MAAKVIGFGSTQEKLDVSKARATIERTFTPEFRNRLDGWILFSGLDAETILKVVDKEVKLLEGQLADKKVKLTLSAEAREWLATKGYDPAFGARPMARLVDQSLKKQLAEAVLFGELSKGGEAHFEVEDDKLVLRMPAVA